MEQELKNHLVKTFRLALNYLRIYPLTSPMVQVALDTLFKTINNIIEKNNSLTFNDVSGKLVIDGEESETKDTRAISAEIIKSFSQHNIQSVTFNSGLEREELADFLSSLLRKKREDLEKYPHIGIDKTVYVAMIKDEDVIVKIKDMMHQASGEIAGIIKSVRDSYDLIDKMPDPSNRKRMQDYLAQELAKQDPIIIRDIFDRELPQKIEESGLKKQLFGALSQEKIQQIFGEISLWYEEIRKRESSDFAAIEQLEKLKSFLQMILQAPAAMEVPRQFFEELIRKGLLNQFPQWFLTEIPVSAVTEVEQLLTKSPESLLEKQVLDIIPNLVQKLCYTDNNELLGKFIDKFLENLKNPSVKKRLIAAQKISSICEILQNSGKENLLRYMEIPLIDATNHETSQEVDSCLLEILRVRARQDLLFEEHKLAIRIIDLFNSKNAQGLIAKLLPEIMEVLIADLKNDHEKKRIFGMQILNKMGEHSVEPLIRIVKESEDVRNRKLAANALKMLGENAHKRFSEELTPLLSKDEIKRMVEALNELGDIKMLKYLQRALSFPDASVKRDIMRFIAKLKNNQADALIVERLNDVDNSVVIEAVRLVVDTKNKEAVPVLLKLLNSRKTDSKIKEEICIALGSLGDETVIPVLKSILQIKPFWFFNHRNENEFTRMRAAWSLRNFAKPEVENILEKAIHDHSEAVSTTAKESLEVIRKL